MLAPGGLGRPHARSGPRADRRHRGVGEHGCGLNPVPWSPRQTTVSSRGSPMDVGWCMHRERGRGMRASGLSEADEAPTGTVGRTETNCCLVAKASPRAPQDRWAAPRAPGRLARGRRALLAAGECSLIGMACFERQPPPIQPLRRLLGRHGAPIAYCSATGAIRRVQNQTFCGRALASRNVWFCTPVRRVFAEQKRSACGHFPSP